MVFARLNRLHLGPTSSHGINLSRSVAQPARMHLTPSRVLMVAQPSSQCIRGHSFATAASGGKAQKKLTPKQQEDAKLRLQKRKDAEKAKLAKQKEAEKARHDKQAEKARVAREKEKEKARLAKEKEKLKAEQARRKARPWELYDTEGRKIPMPTATKPTRKSPFIYYISDVFAKRKADGIKNEGVQSAQFAEVVNGWKKLSEAEQQPYVEKAQREAAEYPAKLAAWEASLTEQDRDRIAKYNRHMRKQKRLAFEEQKATGATAPRPKSPFIRFALQRYNDGKASGEAKSYTETLKAAGEEWRNMSDADKEPWNKPAAQEMAEWTQKYGSKSATV